MVTEKIEEENESSGLVSGAIPVSYTHLDVYKRQSYNILFEGLKKYIKQYI